MTTEKDIDGQQHLIKAHRQTLKILLEQRALHTQAFVPPSVEHGIREARNEIQKVKHTLRTWGISVEDEPNDEDVSIDFQYSNLDDINLLETSESLQLSVQSIREIQITNIISKTLYSQTMRCVLKGKFYVLKKTKLDFCQKDVLKLLIGKHISHSENGLNVKIVTPIAIWISNKYLFELTPYFEAVQLYDIIRKNKYKFNGEYLCSIFNGLFYTIEEIHQLGVIHRDLTPWNILLDREGNIIVVDNTFCCSTKVQQVSMGNREYSAPEQFIGRASPLSDWYSIAATTYFLITGQNPQKQNWQKFQDTLLRFSFGTYAIDSYGFLDIIKSLLNDNIDDRPSRIWEVTLKEISKTFDSRHILSIVDLEDLGLLVIYDRKHETIARNKSHTFFRSLLTERKYTVMPGIYFETLEFSNEIEQDIENFLNNKNLFIKDYRNMD